MKKKKKLCYIIATPFLLLIIIGVGIFTIQEYVIKPFLHHDFSLYEDGKYQEKNGGEYAEVFFQQAKDLIEGSTQKEFYYLDGCNSMRIFHYCDSVFYLEITPKNYEVGKDTLLNSYTIIDNDLFDERSHLLAKRNYSKKNYNFFTVDLLPSLNNFLFPHKQYPSRFGMIGYNDFSQTLCLTFFYYPSLDYLDNMDSFMKTNLFFIL